MLFTLLFPIAALVALIVVALRNLPPPRDRDRDKRK